MEYRGYSEQDLVSNRAAVFLFGGTDAERRDWARESAGNFASEGPMMEVADVQALQSALAQNRGLVFVPDLLTLGAEAQIQILQCIRGIEERPKLILGLSRSPEQALQQGQLREDLSYRLQLARVDMDSPGLREAIRARREAREEALASVKTLVQPSAAKKKGSGVKKRSSRTQSAKTRSRMKKKSRPKSKKSKKSKKAKKAARKAAPRKAASKKRSKKSKKTKKR